MSGRIFKISTDRKIKKGLKERRPYKLKQAAGTVRPGVGGNLRFPLDLTYHGCPYFIKDEWQRIREAIQRNWVFGNNKFKEDIENRLRRKFEIKKAGRRPKM